MSAFEPGESMADEAVVVRLGTWTRVNAETGEVTTGDDWSIAMAVSKALRSE